MTTIERIVHLKAVIADLKNMDDGSWYFVEAIRDIEYIIEHYQIQQRKS